MNNHPKSITAISPNTAKNVALPTADHFNDLSSKGYNSCLSRIDPVAINIKRVIPKARVVT